MSQALQGEYNEYKNTIMRLTQKISELESEVGEHQLVLDTLKPLDENRRCMRMVGGALVDRTVKDVIPTLEETKSGLEKAISTLKSDLTKTEADLDSWKTKHNVKIVSA